MGSLISMLSRPDVLVLGGGGVLGEAWMTGVLAGVEDASGFHLRDCEHFVGTSAGAIVSALLVAGERLRRPAGGGAGSDAGVAQHADVRVTDGLAADRLAADRLAAARATAAQLALETARRAGTLALAAGSPLAPLALALAAPGGALMRAAVLRRLPAPEEPLSELRRRVERSGARLDGRLRVVAVARSSGRRVVFGRPGAPRATVAEAVQASCAVPWLFAPVQIAGKEYVDGGVWSPTNLDAAPAGRDTHVLCLNPTAGVVTDHVMIGLIRQVSSSVVALEALALRRRGASVRVVGPDEDSATAIGPNLMDPGPRARVLAAGYRQGLTLADAGPAR